jgi:hypothetical protein
MKNRSHTHRSGEIFHIAIRVKSLRYAPLSIADLGIIPERSIHEDQASRENKTPENT